MSWEGLLEPLAGERVVLEPLEERHLEELFQASRDEVVWRWLLGRVPTREELQAWLAHALRERDAGREGPFATIDRERGRAVGSTRFLNLRPEHRSLEIGWTWLDPSAWRSGINREAKRLMLGHAFERLRCQRVELKTDVRNTRSRAAICALGARLEGVLRSHMVVPYGDGTRDSAFYAITAADWPAVRARLDRPRSVAGGDDEEGLAVDELPREELERVEPLWAALVAHHGTIAPTLGGRAAARERADAWTRRRATYERWLADPDTFMRIARRGARDVGYAFVTVGSGFSSWATAERIAELQTLSVVPSERSGGVGTALLDAVGERLAGMGVRDLRLTTASTNLDAIRFYGRRGLTPILHVLYGPAVPE